ncbi:MAG: stage II sporulation protein M [Planctomycetia bacterium]|nr:stage II sporulation protein M [Planctomycetia bacterium]
MKVSQLLERRREQWRNLEGLCQELEHRRVRRLGGQAVSHFASLYRAACADLALADAYQLPPDTVRYLHQLVGRAHNQLYRSQIFRWRDWGHEMFQVLPARLLCDRALWLAFAIFWGTFGFSMLLAYASRTYSEQVVGEAMMARLQEMYSKPVTDRPGDASGMMAGFYVMHNAGIGLRCFAAGLLLGIGGLFATLSNAVVLGGCFGFMLTVGERDNFLQFVTARGPFELTAIVLSAAAGMRLGFSLIATDGLARTASLRRAASQATPTIGAAVVLFCLAALIEGFLSPSSLPYEVKAAVAVVSVALMALYIFGLGLRRRV